MGNMTGKREFVASERAALADAFAERGPDQPTLCEGWRTRDLLQHLVLREAGPVRLLRGGRSKVRDADWTALIQQFRDGPPRGSLYRLPGADTAANFEEYFVHHEDVRRAEPGWTRRELPPQIEDAMWRRLSSPFGRIVARRVDVGFHIHRADAASEKTSDKYDGAAAPGTSAPDGVHPAATARPVIPDRFARGEHATLRRSQPGVIVSGPPSELLIFLFGRQGAADVDLHGPAHARDRLMHARLGI